MPPNPQRLIDLNDARNAIPQARQTTQQRVAEVAQRRIAWTKLQRERPPGHSDLPQAESLYTQAVASLKAARTDERTARNDAHRALRKWLDGFVPDDLEEAGELTTALPVVLLPVRIETRFMPPDAPKALHVRIYPDEIAADGHEPTLTEHEIQAGRHFWTTGWNPADEEDAWRALVRRYPPARAAWIVRQTEPTNAPTRPNGTPTFPAQSTARPASWTRPAEARVLPDRWMVLAYRGRTEVRREMSRPVVDPLPLSLDPMEDDPAQLVDISGDGLKIDAGAAWLADYKRAEQAGMAVTIRNLTSVDLRDGFDRIVVLGVKASLTPEQASQRLGELLNAHRFGGGVAFVAQGTPTNNTPEAPSGYPPPGGGRTDSFKLERDALSLAADSNGTRLVRALGLGATFGTQIAHVAGADLTEVRNARAMNNALWPVTLGYYLEQMMEPGIDGRTVREVARFFINHVQGRGPYGAFRIADTPYGVLPATSLARWKVEPGASGPFSKLPLILSTLRPFWLAQIDQVVRLGRTNDADGDLLDVLSMDASAREVRVRGLWGGALIENLFRFYGTQFFGVDGTWAAWSSQRDSIAAQTRVLLNQMGWPVTPAPPAGNPRFATAAAGGPAFRFRFPFVTGDPLSEAPPLTELLGLPASARNYIRWLRNAPILASGGLKSLERDGIDNPPLLFILLRHGLLLEYNRAALDILIARNPAREAERREPEFIDIPLRGTAATNTPVWKRFAEAHPATGAPLAEYLRTGRQPDTRDLDLYRENLDRLAELSSAELERLLTETLDVCSHRLDAWITSLAARRLELMRQQTASDCHLGAFGWAEDVRARATPLATRTVDGRVVFVDETNGGFVQAPSPSHGAAAAILRNGFLSRAAEPSKPFAINLSSARVRRARWLLDLVREGLPLGAILGYQFERRLHELSQAGTLSLEKFIATLRSRYPLVAYKNTKTIPATPAVDVVAGRNVVDGLALFRATDPFTPLNPTTSERQALDAELEGLRELLDAVADLLTAESIFQMVRGNATAAAASLDAMAQGVRPPDPEIAQIPRLGITLTHRMGVLLGGGPLAAGRGWPSAPTPRAAAEEYLDGWFGRLFGDPQTVACRVLYPDPADASRLRSVGVTLDQIAVRPIDLVAMAAEVAATGTSSELDRRVVKVALQTATTAPPAEFAIKYGETGAAPGAKSFLSILELARALNALAGGARSLRPEDLLPAEHVADARTAVRRAQEAEGRIRQAHAELVAASTDLDRTLDDLQGANLDEFDVERDLADLVTALETASLFGIPGAFPATRSATELVFGAESVRTELERRRNTSSNRLNAIADSIAKGTAASDATVKDRHFQTAVEDCIAAAKDIFGRGFVFLPRFTPASTQAAELSRALADVKAIVAADVHAAERWLQQAARARAPLKRWQRVAMYARALGTDPGALDVIQLPHAPSARWSALPKVNPAPGTVSIVLSRPVTPAATDGWVGLLVDEWPELIPYDVTQTGIVFHYDDPGAEAAQAVLVAVPPDPSAAKWDSKTLVDIVNETFELTKARLVEAEMLGALGQLLPAIYLAWNSANAAISTDLGTMRIGDLEIRP